jgi:enoyl-CoA hydratase/carnithine racemase
MLNHLVPSEKLNETTRELCARMMGIPPLVQWISKRIMRAALDSTLENTMVMTSTGGILQNSEDAKEARRAFIEKRKGQFKGI